MMRWLVMILAVMFASCASTPEQARQKCLAHEVPNPSAASEVGSALGNVFTLGAVGRVNSDRNFADCSVVLSDENLKASCPAYALECEQYFAERQAGAGASKVIVNQVNH